MILFNVILVLSCLQRFLHPFLHPLLNATICHGKGQTLCRGYGFVALSYFSDSQLLVSELTRLPKFELCGGF